MSYAIRRFIRALIVALQRLLDEPGPAPGPQPRLRELFRVERVQEFLRSKTEKSDGQRVEAKFLWEQFFQSLPVDERRAWTRNRFYRELRNASYIVEPGTANKLFVDGILVRLGGTRGV